MTSSARCSSEGGTVRLSALAVSEVDDQFELDWCLDWQLARRRATQDAVNIDRYSAG